MGCLSSSGKLTGSDITSSSYSAVGRGSCFSVATKAAIQCIKYQQTQILHLRDGDCGCPCEGSQTLNGAILPSCVRKLWNRDVRNRYRLFCGQQKSRSGMGAAVRSNLRGQKRRFRNHTSDLDHRVHFPHTIYVDEGPKGTTGFKIIASAGLRRGLQLSPPCQSHLNGCGTLQGRWRSDPRKRDRRIGSRSGAEGWSA